MGTPGMVWKVAAVMLLVCGLRGLSDENPAGRSAASTVAGDACPAGALRAPVMSPRGATSGPPQAAASGWRRTAQGWQHRSQWPISRPLGGTTPPPIPCGLHPLVVASLMLLVSIAALLLFDRPAADVA